MAPRCQCLGPGMVRAGFLEEKQGPALPGVGEPAPPPNGHSPPEHQRMGPRGATLSWGRSEDPGLQRGASSLFLPTGLACSASQVACLGGGGRFPASDATDFCGNSRGCVLKGPLFPQDNRSLVPWTMLFSSLACTWGQPGRCPTGHLPASGTMRQGLSQQPGLPAVHLGSGRGALILL